MNCTLLFFLLYHLNDETNTFDHDPPCARYACRCDVFFIPLYFSIVFLFPSPKNQIYPTVECGCSRGLIFTSRTRYSTKFSNFLV